jgi:Fe-S-cluster containining protein
MGSILCEHCAAACCRYLAIEIDRPSSARDYDDIRWYLMHEGISVFVEEGDWYIQVRARCKNLGPDNLCQIYETRPRICRAYEPNNCDYSAGDHGYDHLFTHAKQIEQYYFEKTGKRLGQPKLPERKPKAANRRKRKARRKQPA